MSKIFFLIISSFSFSFCLREPVLFSPCSEIFRLSCFHYVSPEGSFYSFKNSILCKHLSLLPSSSKNLQKQRDIYIPEYSPRSFILWLPGNSCSRHCSQRHQLRQGFYTKLCRKGVLSVPQVSRYIISSVILNFPQINIPRKKLKNWRCLLDTLHGKEYPCFLRPENKPVGGKGSHRLWRASGGDARTVISTTSPSSIMT